ncbi:MAG TPA: ABC transporter permease subunit [Mycobacteriales bacterium]|nr:ABC transporter permease subunit [Mycobacteriales bacterium]
MAVAIAAHPVSPSRWRDALRTQRLASAAGIAPFAAYTVLFLLVPTVAVVVGAFQKPGGGYTLDNLDTAVHGVYLHGFETSLRLSLFASVIPAFLGLVVAYAVHTASPTSAIRRVVVTASGVFANFGGVPLAFIFIVTLGSNGLVTGWLSDVGFDPYAHGLTLYGLSGVALVYLYFQIPLMVLVILPALEGLRPAWREAARNLGASSWQYWLRVGGPVLTPSFLGAMLLLFGSAFSAYATAEAQTSGSIPLTSIQIGSFLNGNVISGQQNVGKALGFGMIVITAAVMVLYTLLQRRASRWSR